MPIGQYYVLWVVCNEGAPTAPDGRNPHSVDQFVQCVETYWKNNTFQEQQMAEKCGIRSYWPLAAADSEKLRRDRGMLRHNTSPMTSKVFMNREELVFYSCDHHILAHHAASISEEITAATVKD
jgi:hypothetical protein